jgi:hypothetical protein
MNQSNGEGLQEIRIRLLRTPDDPPERDPAFQQELNQFKDSLRSAGIPYSQRGMAFDSAAATGYPLAELIIKELGPAAVGVLGTAVGAWISGRHGRKVRLRIGDIEAEGRTKEEVIELLNHARTLQNNQEGSDDEA